jgi:hypothetical protein
MKGLLIVKVRIGRWVEIRSHINWQRDSCDWETLGRVRDDRHFKLQELRQWPSAKVGKL